MAQDTPGMPRVYRESLDDGPGGWHGWISNAAGPRPLDVRDGCLITRSPWWIDYNHAPPGAGEIRFVRDAHRPRPFPPGRGE